MKTYCYCKGRKYSLKITLACALVVGVYILRHGPYLAEQNIDVFNVDEVYRAFWRRTNWTSSVSFFPPDNVPLYTQPRTPWIPQKFFNASTYCNDYKHKFIISNSQLCRGKKVLLVVGVRSVGGAAKSRQLIRETWGSLKHFQGVHMVTVFLLGKSNNISVEKAIARENQLYNDIIQADFMDSYINLTIKTQSIFKWMRDYCSHAQFLAMTDADMFVDMYKLNDFLLSANEKSNDTYTLCKVEWFGTPVRPPYEGHAAMPEGEYPSNEYANFCWGGAYVITLSVMNKLYHASLHTPRLRIDDVWLGILAERAGLKFVPTGEAFISPWHENDPLLHHRRYFDGPVMFAGWHKGDIERKIRNMWNMVTVYSQRT